MKYLLTAKYLTFTIEQVFKTKQEAKNRLSSIVDNHGDPIEFEIEELYPVEKANETNILLN